MKHFNYFEFDSPDIQGSGQLMDSKLLEMIDLVRDGYNVAVSRTFSKIYGLAGQRVGYMIGQPDVINGIRSNGTGEASLSMAGVSAAIASYEDKDFMNFSRSKINEAKEMVQLGLTSNGLTYMPSQTNFIFLRNAFIFSQKCPYFSQKVLSDKNKCVSGAHQDFLIMS